MPTKRTVEKRVDELEPDDDYERGDLSSYLAAARAADSGEWMVDEERRLYRYEGTVYQLPAEVLEMEIFGGDGVEP